MARYLRYTFITILLVVLQVTIVPFIAIEGVRPDLLLIYVVIISLREGQIPGTIAGFAVGLISDLAVGEFIGLGALTKTGAGFIAGYFYNEMSPLQSLGNYKFLFIVALAGVLHNFVYHMLFLQGLPLTFAEITGKYVLGTTVYTLAVALIPLFQYSSAYRSGRVKG